MSAALRLLVLVSAAWSVAALAVELARTRAHGRARYYARPAAPAWRGVVYALGPGMSPAAKESTRANLPAWAAGVSYHLGIFAGLVALALTLLDVAAPAPVRAALAALTALGALSGLALLLRRLLAARLRRLSCLDDGVSNLLVTGFVALACVTSLHPATRPLFLAEAALLLFYVPLGKIRHCAFFFLTRFLAGDFFGRRGAYPPAA